MAVHACRRMRFNDFYPTDGSGRSPLPSHANEALPYGRASLVLELPSFNPYAAPCCPSLLAFPLLRALETLSTTRTLPSYW